MIAIGPQSAGVQVQKDRPSRANYPDDLRDLGPTKNRLTPPTKCPISVQGFGCRPVETHPTVLTAGFRKPPRKEPAGAGWPACGLWRFAGAASCVGDAVAGVVGVGPTIAVSIWSSRRRSMG